MNDHAPERPEAAAPRQPSRRSTTREQRQLEILDAVLRHGGSQAKAAAEIGCTSANVGLHLRRLRLLVPRDRTATLDAIQRYVAGHAFTRTVEARAAKAQRAETVVVPARCHPAREEFSLGLCSECYRERVMRSRGVATRPAEEVVDPQVVAKLASAAPVGPPPAISFRPRHAVGETLTAAELSTMEALIAAGGRQDRAAEALDVSPHTVRRHVQDVYEKTGTSTLVGAYAAIGWLRPDYEETMIQEFRRTLEHFDAAIHRAMGQSRRVAE